VYGNPVVILLYSVTPGPYIMKNQEPREVISFPHIFYTEHLHGERAYDVTRPTVLEQAFLHRPLLAGPIQRCI